MSWNPVFFGLPAGWIDQSRYLHLQAAGSDGSDGSLAGHHLRWGLRGNLGAKHLPKGNLASTAQFATTVAFNKPDDYVKLHRFEYVPLPTTVNFMTQQPVVVNHQTRTWVFECHVFIVFMGDPDDGIFTNLTVRFLDGAQYDSLIGLAPGPGSSNLPYQLMQKYKGVVEFETVGKLCFGVQTSFERKDPSYGGASSYRLEGITCDATDANTSSAVKVGLRKTKSVPLGTGVVTEKHFCENMRLIRMDYSECRIKEIRLETYYDQLWHNHVYMPLVSQHALTVSDTDAYGSLNSSAGLAPHSWPKFNDGAKVKVGNYQDRWTDPNNGLGIKESVRRYLALSTTAVNLEASELLASSTPGDNSSMEVKHLQLLKLMSMDFHLARMLGHGAVNDSDTPTKTYLWVAKYETLIDEETMVSGVHHHHCYMSLPTRRTDYRLPVTPAKPSITYGLWLDNGGSTPTLITDAHGYLPWAAKRYVNLHKPDFPYEFPSALYAAPFFQSTVEFNLGTLSRTAMYGIEYRQDGASAWRDPELSNDSDYVDGNGVEEAMPVPDQANPIFIHEETEAGIHDYALYAVNLFSRPSAIGQHDSTDTTVFAPLQTMVPPLNMSAQYIQEETPLIFTTQNEQANHQGDTRITFDWNHIQNHAYQPVDKAQFFYRLYAPAQVSGLVTTVVDLGGSDCEVWTGPYLITSQSPAQTLQPYLDAGLYPRFVGSMIAVGNEHFLVESVAANPWTTTLGNDPVFRCKKQREVSVVDPLNDGHFVAVESFQMPLANQGFTIAENLANNDQGQWNPLVREVDIVSFSSYVEQVTESDGSISEYNYGGIAEMVTTTHEGDGVYRLSFPTYVLAPHVDPSVEWYRGTCRILFNTNPLDVYTCEVWDINLNLATLEIRIYAPDFSMGTLPANILVNFHPGYRFYLGYEGQAQFDKARIEPAAGTNTRVTFVSARSVDSSTGNTSYLHVPVPLLAREIVEPMVPLPPVGPTFATRPDFYGKSTYTFDTPFELADGQMQPRTPHAMIFYRANEQNILDALYKPSTVTGIVFALQSMTNDTFVTQRWQDLVGFVVETSGPDAGRFLEHNGYRFPAPDNDATDAAFTGNALPGTILSKVKAAVHRAFLPLTRNPVVYVHLHTGTQTSKLDPKLRDGNGALLLPGDPAFDPYPMARIAGIDTQNAKAIVRFTDYTLDGSSQNVYFYCAQEMTATMRLSDYSSISGPISLVNALPAERPEILKVVTQLPNSGTGSVAGIRFEINSYPESAGVKKFKIYRATDIALAQNVRTMQEAAVADIGTDAVDTFSDLNFPPYSETLFYRVVAMREIINETGLPELIPSLPSNLVLSSVIDTQNPAAPVITHAVGTVLSNPARLENVTLTWPMTAWNAKYYLYRMNSKGNWVKIYEIKTNDPGAMIYPQQGSFVSPYMETALLPKEDDDGNPLYHRFKVVAENASGLLTLRDAELTI